MGTGLTERPERKDDARLPTLAERVTQPRDQLEPARTAADDNDLGLAPGRGHPALNSPRSIESPTAFRPAGLPWRWSPK